VPGDQRLRAVARRHSAHWFLFNFNYLIFNFKTKIKKCSKIIM
jgi:hypothetical protein